jgi:anaerobic magnesium-protoporphyrin IX monomethyl ester cyclase
MMMHFFVSSHTINDDLKIFSKIMKEKVDDLSWQVEIRPDIVSELSMDSIGYAIDRGLKQFNMGIEKKCESNLQSINKPYHIEKLKQFCLDMKRTYPDFRLAGTFILGGPNETELTIKETVNFSKELGLLYAHYYPLELYPGTPLYQKEYENQDREWYAKVMADDWYWGGDHLRKQWFLIFQANRCCT